MRSVLPLAFVLLLLAAILRFLGGAWFAEDARGPDAATSIMVTSRGHLLPEVPLAGGTAVAPDAIAVGDMLLKSRETVAGLRIVLLNPDLSLNDFQTLDLFQHPERADGLESIARRALEGEVLVLAVQGQVSPGGEEAARLDDAMQALGARVTPFRAGRASWALISTFHDGEWSAVAEAYSETLGVTLSATLSSSIAERARGGSAELLFTEATGLQSLELSEELTSSARRGNRIYRNNWVWFADTVKPALVLPVGSVEGSPDSGLIEWQGLELGTEPSFSVHWGVVPALAEHFHGAKCQLLIDGQVEDEVRLETGTDWQPWTVDLSGHAKQMVSVGLRLLPLEGEAVQGDSRARVFARDAAVSWQSGQSTEGASDRTLLGGAALPAVEELPLLPPSLAANAWNRITLGPSAKNVGHTFLIGGHLYGRPGAEHDPSPSVALVESLPRINACGAKYFISLGDIIRHATKPQMDLLHTNFVEQLRLPLWNAVGNHDVPNRPLFMRKWPQPTVGYLKHGPVLHLIFDTEINPGRIAKRQLGMLTNALEMARAVDDIRSIAIHSHRLIWTDGRPAFDIVRQRVNNRAGYQNDGAFVRDILPAVRELAAVKPVVWFSGDIGVPHSFSLFHHKESDVDLRWVAIGLGGVESDALLQVHVAPDGVMSFEVMPINGGDLMPLENYDLAFWKEHFRGR